jgi:Transglycosylase SLT domain
MESKLNHRFIMTLITAAAVFFAFGMYVNKPASKIVKVQPVVQLVQATQSSFQVNEARYFAYQLLTPKQFACLDYVITNESHWNALAKNPTSSAKGIGQLLKSTYENIGMKFSSDPRSQVVATLAYIARWYGSGGPCAAKAHWIANHWY